MRERQAAWKGFERTAQYPYKKSTQACHDKLVNTNMERGQDPDDFSFVTNNCRNLLEKMEHAVARWFVRKHYSPSPPPAEYERGRVASYEKPDFGLDDIRHMAHSMCVDNLLRPSTFEPVAGHGIEIKAIARNSSDARCHHYSNAVGHITQDCAAPKSKVCWNEQNQS